LISAAYAAGLSFSFLLLLPLMPPDSLFLLFAARRSFFFLTLLLFMPLPLCRFSLPAYAYNFSESSALISWGFQHLFFKNHLLFSQKHLTNQSKNAALRALNQKVLF